MLFSSVFKELKEKGATVTLELKNDIQIRGRIIATDQYLNFKLTQVEIVNKDVCPHLLPMKTCFVRGSVIRYIHIPPEYIMKDILLDATRQGN